MGKPRVQRGATTNKASTRFALPEREPDGDWLDDRDVIDGPARAVQTSVQPLHPKSIISYNKTPDVPFDRSINPIVGCDHPRNGCVTPEAIA